MKLTSHNSAPCTIFGHNFFKVKTNALEAVILCSCCGHKTNEEFYNDLNDSFASNLNIQKLLRHLFILRRKHAFDSIST